MLYIIKETVNDIMKWDNKPAGYCKSGDTIVFETRDCYDNTITSSERPLGDREGLSNPVTGALYVEGAEVGDILKIEIEDIKLRSWGIMRSSTTAGVFHEKYEKREAIIFQVKDNKIYFDDKLILDADPMIGVIGTAPIEKEGIPTTTPGKHGGNMDCKKIVKGSTIYLPVNVKGGLLSMGDIHALMGDGEVFICGLEIAGEITVKVSVLKNIKLPTPFLYSRGKVMSIQSAEDLDKAGDMAAKEMFEFVKEATKQDDVRTGMLMSLLSDMAVCQVVDPLLTVRVEFPLDVLEKYGYKLP
ncbi:MAG: acetamidase/formamidase family protein [Fusobacterium sp.]|uniref:acetamidase/formamidase family protein n=1 Tax=Fusobacterium sp. TaxID=68766 RepID=UPI002A75B3D8|nr:acetamidase/formamidase family protein [Fusobacterium sp.]MDY3060294.1 acetamidase/formamidase family protein [Fusobacterium sp.]